MVAGHPSTSESQRHGYNAQGRREDWVSDSLLSGFVATFAMGAALAIAYGLAHWIGDANGGRVEQWFYGLQHNVITDRTGNSVILALGLNLAMGLIFALIYGAVEQRLPGREGIQRGMIFALIPWLLSIIAFFPILDGGIFGKDLHAGPLPIVGNLVLHLIYGAVLGLTYHVDLDAWLDGSQEDHDSALILQEIRRIWTDGRRRCRRVRRFAGARSIQRHDQYRHVDCRRRARLRGNRRVADRFIHERGFQKAGLICQFTQLGTCAAIFTRCKR